MTVLALDNRLSSGNRSYSTGSNKVSEELVKLIKKISQGSSPSVTWERSDNLVRELFEIYDDCSSVNWDGYNSRPLTKKSLSEAETFIRAMPIWLPTPEIVPEPDGDIGFQWSFGKDRILTVSLSGKNIVTYAAILGSAERKKYGTEPFNNTIPEEIIKGIGQIRPENTVAANTTASA